MHWSTFGRSAPTVELTLPSPILIRRIARETPGRISRLHASIIPCLPGQEDARRAPSALLPEDQAPALGPERRECRLHRPSSDDRQVRVGEIAPRRPGEADSGLHPRRIEPRRRAEWRGRSRRPGSPRSPVRQVSERPSRCHASSPQSRRASLRAGPARCEMPCWRSNRARVIRTSVSVNQLPSARETRSASARNDSADASVARAASRAG